MVLDCILSRNSRCGSDHRVSTLYLQTVYLKALTSLYAKAKFGSKGLNLWPTKGCKLHILQLAYVNMSVLLEISVLHM